MEKYRGRSERKTRSLNAGIGHNGPTMAARAVLISFVRKGGEVGRKRASTGAEGLFWVQGGRRPGSRRSLRTRIGRRSGLLRFAP